MSLFELYRVCNDFGYTAELINKNGKLIYSITDDSHEYKDLLIGQDLMITTSVADFIEFWLNREGMQ